EEDAPVEEEAARDRAPPHDAGGVRGVAELGARLARIQRASLDVSQGLIRRRVARRGLELAAALARVVPARLVERVAERLQRGEALHGEGVDVEERDRVGARVEDGADERRRVRDVD